MVHYYLESLYQCSRISVSSLETGSLGPWGSVTENALKFS